MRLGIDTYSFHRYFGELHQGQDDPGIRLDYLSLMKRLDPLQLDGICIETCFLDPNDHATVHAIREAAAQRGLEIVLAWGHPMGLQGGSSDEAQRDLERWIEAGGLFGSRVMRIVGSNRRLMSQMPRDAQVEQLIERLSKSVRVAERAGIRLAIENHIDFVVDEIAKIVEAVGSPWLGVTYDSGNAVRVGDDPVEGARRLGRHVAATHLKDLAPIRGADPDFWASLASVPIGEGIIDVLGVVRELQSAGYDGLYAVELDYLHPDWTDEFEAAAASINQLRSVFGE